MRPLAGAQVLDPPPPADLRWVAFKGANIPQLTRDGRRWGNDLASRKPDSYAKLLVNGVELLRTNVESNSLSPTWRDSPRGNFRIQANDRFRIELWDARALNDHPIGVKDFGTLRSEFTANDEIEVECESGAHVTVADEPAHGRVGYGFYYEMRTYDLYVTRVFEESPAARAGMRVGDQLLGIQNKPPREMREGEAQSLLNSQLPAGLELSLRHEDGAIVTVHIKEGAIYPLFREVGTFE